MRNEDFCTPFDFFLLIDYFGGKEFIITMTAVMKAAWLKIGKSNF